MPGRRNQTPCLGRSLAEESVCSRKPNLIFSKCSAVLTLIGLLLGWLYHQKNLVHQIQQEMISQRQNIAELEAMLTKVDKEFRKDKFQRLNEGTIFSENNFKEIGVLVKKQLEIYDSDKTGMPDFALEMGGGKVISIKNTQQYDSEVDSLSVFGIPLCTQKNKANTILQPSVMPGHCWAVNGQTANVIVKLSARIYVTAVSIEHLPKSLSPTGDNDSAPKEFSIWGLMDEEGSNESHYFGQFTYNKDGPSLQTFEVQKPKNHAFPLIEFKLHSNHGRREYTCIYRLRVHGTLHNSLL